MRYFFLAYALIALLVVGIFGLRGQKFTKPPIRIFPDMDEQDKLRAQKPDPFFADGQGGRLPVSQTQPRGFNPEGATEIGGIPGELKLTDESAAELIRRGEERFNIYCAVCHGASGNGQGVTSNYGVPVAGNQNAKLNAINPDMYPDGRLFETITNGKGLMGGYGSNVPVRDRWAIIAYIHTLQAAKASSK
jgi:mono/diheme cytochrome c family protein